MMSRLCFGAIEIACVIAAVGACGGATAVDEGAAPRPESDERPSFVLHLDDAAVRARFSRPLGGGRVLLVDDGDRLLVVDGSKRRTLLDAVIGEPALRGRDASFVVAARATAPGQSDLWLVALDGARPRALAAARGADGQPFFLDDGRVLFVSDRSGVASVYLVDVERDPQRALMLTNEGERPGALSPAFVPPPVRWLAQEGSVVRYDAGGRTVTIALPARAEVR